MPKRSLPEDLQQLLDLIQTGKLFALQDWIKAGKPLRPPAEPEGGAFALRAAVTTGFHSLVEELLRAPGWTQDDLTDALELARSRKRYDIAELLTKYGAREKPIDFLTACEQLDTATMERLLRAGTDPNHDNAFCPGAILGQSSPPPRLLPPIPRRVPRFG